MKKTALQIKIQALNMLNSYAQAYFEQATKHFEQFIGVEPYKVDGTLKAKYALKFEPVKGKTVDGTNYDVHAWMYSGNYSLDINVKICISGGSYEEKPATAFCQYESLSLMICRIKDGKLAARDIENYDFSVQYNEQQILRAAEEVKKAAERYEQALKTVPYYFRDILYIERLTR